MLSEREIKDFLALLLAYALATGSSGRDCAAYFNVTPNTMCRWLAAARTENAQDPKVERAYWVRVEPIRQRILAMNAYDEKAGAYTRIRATTRSADKRKLVAALLKKLGY